MEEDDDALTFSAEEEEESQQPQPRRSQPHRSQRHQTQEEEGEVEEGSKDKRSCPICLQSLDEAVNEPPEKCVVQTPCEHHFHRACIAEWAMINVTEDRVQPAIS